MQQYTLITLLALISLQLAAKTKDNANQPSALCLDGKITWVVNKKEHKEDGQYCLHKNIDGHSLTSQNCLDANTTCQAKQSSSEPIPSDKIYQKLGSPHFHLCHYLKGKPQFVKVWDKKHWIPLTRCLFPDKSYVDLHQLQRYHAIAVNNVPPENKQEKQPKQPSK